MPLTLIISLLGELPAPRSRVIRRLSHSLMQSWFNVLCISVFFICHAAGATNTEVSWSSKELSMLKRLYISKPLAAPASPSNRVADNLQAVQLGKKLFFDTRLSRNNDFSCATCHQPAYAFTDRRSRAAGMGTAMRNTPTLVGSANYKWHYWDGRSDSLWSQALIPLESADEMGGSRVAILRTIMDDPEYAKHYQQLFGDLPATTTLANLPQHAGPLGDLTTRTAWYQLPEKIRHQINTFYANIGKVLAAYERTLQLQPTRFDRYAAELLKTATASKARPIVFSSHLMTESEIQGLKLYLNDKKTNCRNCHNGRSFSNSEFYDINTAKLDGKRMDYGRALGLDAARHDPFNCLGKYSDLPDNKKAKYCRLSKLNDEKDNTLMVGAFKTPSLRGLVHTAPYFHNGRLETLEGVLQYYAEDAHRLKQTGVHNKKIIQAKQEHAVEPLQLTRLENRALLAFLLALSN